MQPDELPPEVKELLDALPTDPTQFAEWNERNRLRKTRIAMETGVPYGEIG